MKNFGIALLALTSVITLSDASITGCAHLNNCNNHGRCDVANSRCICYNGFGSESDIATYKAPDCSARTCPNHRAWVDIPTGVESAHGFAECSNQGICDRSTGRCRCFAGFEGEACQRSTCPGSPTCSGHGRCVSLLQLGDEARAEPIGPPLVYGGFPESKTWDQEKIQGCLCDSIWAVGYGDKQTQVPQWTGYDCSVQRCPSGDDVRTVDVDETDCEYFDKNGAVWKGYIGSDGRRYKSVAAMPPGVTVDQAPSCTPGVDCGAPGNKCYVECSNRGICDRGTGQCKCFAGYNGAACNIKSRF